MRLTKEGKKFLIATALIGISAINTGNNLIYLIFSMMLSLLVIAWLALRLNLRGLDISLDYKEPIFAKKKENIFFVIKNKKRLLPSFSLRITILGVDGIGIVPYIAPLGEVSEEVALIFPKRGAFGLKGVFLESGFPFIFFRKKIEIPVGKELIIFPEIIEIEPPLFKTLGGTPTIKRGTSEDMLYLREFRKGDDLKKVDWKATAKTGTLIVKETSAEDSESVLIIVDNTPPEGELFERAVSCAASLAFRYIEEGFSVGLLSLNQSIPFGRGKEHLYLILRRLAFLKTSKTGTLPEMRSEVKRILISKSRGLGLRPLSDVVIYAESL